MNKQKFIELVGAAEKASAAEVKALEKLVQQYPYFQNGHVVLAKASQVLKLPSTPKKMNTAAVYATNRAVFKNYITSKGVSTPVAPKASPAATPTTKTPRNPMPPAPKGEMDKIIEEVYANLENWKSSREQYLEYEKEHPEDIVILPVDAEEEIESSPEIVEETPDYEKLKQQIADEVNKEEATEEEKIEETTSNQEEATEIKAEKDSSETDAPGETPVATKEVPVEESKAPSAFDQVLDNIEAQIDSKVAETRKKQEESQVEDKKEEASGEESQISELDTQELSNNAVEETTEVEAEESVEDAIEESPEPIKNKDEDSGPEIEELDDQMAALEDQIAESSPEMPAIEEIPEEPEAETETNTEASESETAVEPESTEDSAEAIDEDDESAPPTIDDTVEEITPDTVYSFNSPPPVPQEAPADLSKKKPVEQKEEPEQENEMISSEELTEIVDKVSEKVESETGEIDELSEETSQEIEKELEEIDPYKTQNEETPASKKEIGNLEDPSAEEIAESESIEYQIEGSDEDLDQYNEERKKLKLVPGASKGDKKFRLAILKRPHNFTKPKKEEGKKKDTKAKTEGKPDLAPKTETKTTAKKTKTASSKKKEEESSKTKKTTKKASATKKTTTAKKTTAKKSTKKKETDVDQSAEESKPKSTSGTKSKKKLSPKKKASDKKDTSDDEESKKKTTELKKKRPDKNFQNSIIDSFIASDPSIEVNKDKKSLPENTEDLSERSTAFPDQVVTENLASILTEQGKISRAIEIYEKLILKNPQKKAYFASQIEKLNNL